ncbi:hypothetical protein BJX64DRAFT_262738 [Aspergillus heterothallicus]
MRQIAVTKQLKLKIDSIQVIPNFASRYLSQPTNPIRPKILWLTENRDPNTLWWRISTAELTGYKRVVRSWHGRRARTAFQKELKNRGFDAQGRKLVTDTQGSAKEPGGNLKGSAVVVVRPGCLEGNYFSMQRDMKTLVDAMMEEQVVMQRNPHSKIQTHTKHGKHQATRMKKSENLK